MTALVAIVTVLVLLFYVWTGVHVGRMRGRHKIDAPAMIGHPEFERAVRVQANTLEWLVIFLPAMWICADYVNSFLAAALGVIWIVGRYMYMQGYLRDPKQRSTGFMIQMGATAVALFGGLIGAVIVAVTGGGGV